jgi:hypothetical protein
LFYRGDVAILETTHAERPMGRVGAKCGEERVDRLDSGSGSDHQSLEVRRGVRERVGISGVIGVERHAGAAHTAVDLEDNGGRYSEPKFTRDGRIWGGGRGGEAMAEELSKAV